MTIIYHEIMLRNNVFCSIKKLAERGILHKLELEYQLASPCSRKEEKLSNVHVLTLNEVAGMFVVLAAGMGASFTVLLIEIVFKDKKNIRCKHLKISSLCCNNKQYVEEE